MAIRLWHIAIENGYNWGMQVSVAEAKNKLPALIKRAESGERITICRHGEPVVDLVRTDQPSRKQRKLGTQAGKAWEIDPDWWKPMTEEETEAFLEGRY
jgi:prevent-host-death family protein